MAGEQKGEGGFFASVHEMSVEVNSWQYWMGSRPDHNWSIGWHSNCPCGDIETCHEFVALIRQGLFGAFCTFGTFDIGDAPPIAVIDDPSISPFLLLLHFLFPLRVVFVQY